MKRFIIAAAVSMAMLGSAPSYAADLGGNCCADLEERIAELEATAARKGNRKVSLMVSGQVNKAIVWTEDDQTVVDNSTEGTRVLFSGSAGVAKDIKAGFVLELQTNADEDGFLDPTRSGEIGVRRSAVWVGVDRISVTIGRFDTATHELIDMTTANTTVAVKPLNIFGEAPQAGIADLVRGDITIIDGLTVSASWAPGFEFGDEDLLSVAARYTGKLGDVRLMAGLGYDTLDGDGLFSATASAMHVPTGLFLTGAAVREKESGGDTSWHVTGGVERKFIDLGATTLFAEYGRWEIDGGADVWGFGAVQHVDALALDVYVSLRDYDSEQIAITGARVKF